jgi:fluoroacetyl-CoA thioesterase
MMEDGRFPIGASATRDWTVGPAVTVAAHGTVDLPVLATPHLIFMLEDTCVFAAAPFLEEGATTVGTSVHVDHLATARVGELVTSLAELVSVRGRRLVFRIEARRGTTPIARGLHERAVVDKKEFQAKLRNGGDGR